MKPSQPWLEQNLSHTSAVGTINFVSDSAEVPQDDAMSARLQEDENVNGGEPPSTSNDTNTGITVMRRVELATLEDE